MRDETGKDRQRQTELEILHAKIGSFLKRPDIEQHITDALNPKTSDNTILEQAFNLFGKLEGQLYDEFGIEFTTQLIRSYALANDPLIRRIMDELSKHKEQFQHIFETEQGSLYFVLPNRQSLRFQRQNSHEPEIFLDQPLPPATALDKPNIEFYKMREIADQCVFIPPREKARIVRIKMQEYRNRGNIDMSSAEELLRKINRIQTTQFGTGVSPVELKLYPAFLPELYIGRLKPDSNDIIDTTSLFVPPPGYPGEFTAIANIHLGHPVTRIVYNRAAESLPPEPK